MAANIYAKQILGLGCLVWLVACGLVRVACADSCSSVMTGLRTHCAQYVMGASPPQPPAGGACCRVIKSPSVPCVCNSIPPGALFYLNRPAILNAIASCGLHLRPGTQCAGMTYPGSH